MNVQYHNTQTDVYVGDHVEFKVWLFFWKGWQKGRVMYVPGKSKKQSALEHNGLAWVSIHDENDARIGVLVDSEFGKLRPNVRFVKRSDDHLKETPNGYVFEKEDEQEKEK